VLGLLVCFDVDDGPQLKRNFTVLVQVTIGSEDLKANHMIQQIFEFPQEFEKYALLVRRTEGSDCCACVNTWVAFGGGPASPCWPVSEAAGRPQS